MADSALRLSDSQMVGNPNTSTPRYSRMGSAYDRENRGNRSPWRTFSSILSRRNNTIDLWRSDDPDLAHEVFVLIDHSDRTEGFVGSLLVNLRHGTISTP